MVFAVQEAPPEPVVGEVAQIRDLDSSVVSEQITTAPATPSQADDDEDYDEDDDSDQISMQSNEENSKGKCVKFQTPICSICKMDFAMPGLFEKHMKSEHGEDYPYPCSHDNCEKKFAKWYQRDAHLKIHDPDRFKGQPEWACGLCDRMYHIRTSLYAHWRTMHPGVTPPKPVKKVVSTPKTPKPQPVQAAPTPPPPPPPPKVCTPPPPPMPTPPQGTSKGGSSVLKVFKCRVCGESTFPTYSDLYHHRVRKHKQVAFIQEKEKCFTCGVCYKPFFTREDAIICNLHGHDPAMIVFNGEYKMDESKCQLIREKGIPGGVAFEVPLFEDSSGFPATREEQQELAEMMVQSLSERAQVGVGDGPQVCTICGDHLSRRGNLKRHLTTVHCLKKRKIEDFPEKSPVTTPAPTPPAPKIKKSLGILKPLEMERWTGKDDEPTSFQCKFCDKTFPKKRALHFHEVRGHINPKKKVEEVVKPLLPSEDEDNVSTAVEDESEEETEISNNDKNATTDATRQVSVLLTRYTRSQSGTPSTKPTTSGSSRALKRSSSQEEDDQPTPKKKDKRNASRRRIQTTDLINITQVMASRLQGSTP